MRRWIVANMMRALGMKGIAGKREISGGYALGTQSMQGERYEMGWDRDRELDAKQMQSKVLACKDEHRDASKIGIETKHGAECASLKVSKDERVTAHGTRRRRKPGPLISVLNRRKGTSYAGKHVHEAAHTHLGKTTEGGRTNTGTSTANVHTTTTQAKHIILEASRHLPPFRTIARHSCPAPGA